VTDLPASPVRYRVSYSERVRTELRKLIEHIPELSEKARILAAVRDIDERLQVYYRGK
jgi:hypothetical protein